jgi:hypothetical protein
MAILQADREAIFGSRGYDEIWRDDNGLLGRIALHSIPTTIHHAVIYTREELPHMKSFLAMKSGMRNDEISALSIVVGTDEVDAIQRNQLSGTWYLVEVQEVGTAIVAKKPVAALEIDGGTDSHDED